MHGVCKITTKVSHCCHLNVSNILVVSHSIAYSPNGNQLAAGADDKKVTVYDLENKG